MSARSTFRSWFRPARPAAPRPTFRPMLEELEARLPPGDVMSLIHAGTGLPAPALSADAVAGSDGAPAAEIRILASASSGLEPAVAAAKNTQTAAASAAAPAAKYGTDGQASVNNPTAAGDPGADPFALFAHNAVAPPKKKFVPPDFWPVAAPYKPPLTLTGPGAVGHDALSAGGAAAVIPVVPGAWTLIGPQPVTGAANVGGNPTVSGRIAGLAADPTNANIIYMAAAGGGVWKTTDGGVTWNPLTDGQSTLFMGAIAVAPSNGNVIYAGTGEATNSGDSYYGRGVLKSSDGGATWTLENDSGAFNLSTISKIAISPTDANTVYVAIDNQGVNGNPNVVDGIYKSTDGGATWTNTTTAITNVTAANQFSDVVIDPANANTLYCAVGDPGGSTANGVYESTNAGGSWAATGATFAALDNGDGIGSIKLAISASNPKVLFASAADAATDNLDFVATTTDGGTTWAGISPGVDYLNGQGSYDQTVAIDPTNPKVAYVGGAFNNTDANGNFINQVLETTDGGTTWTDITVGADGNGVHPDHHAMTFDANGKLLDGNDGGVWRLANPTVGAVQWTDLNAGLSTLQFYGIALHPTDPNTAYGGTQDNGTSKFTGALPWTQIQGGDGGFARVDFNNPNTIYQEFFRLQGSTSFIQRSDDGGVTFTDISPGINSNDNSDFIVPYKIDPQNSSRLILVTDHVYETTNKGATWTIIGTSGGNGLNSTGTLDAVAVNGQTIYVADSTGNIFVTTNDGASWVKHNIPTVTDHINDLIVDSANANSVYAVRDRFGVGKVFHSTDGGATWTDISGNLPDLPTYALAHDAANNVLYAGNDSGVYTSSNGGASWSRFGTNLPNVQVRELELNSTTGILAAGTHGRSVWEISTAAGGGGGGGGGGFGQEPEPNQTSDAATDFGTLGAGAAQGTTVTGEGIVPLPAGQNDYDWYRWTAGQAGTFTATEMTTAGGNLELHLFTLQGNTLVELARSTAAGVSSQALSAAVAAGDTILVEVKGQNASFGVMTQGVYNLSATLT